MDKFNRLYRIYRFYILSILFCIFIPNLVYFKKDIYKILYSLPSFEMLFYPVYSVMVTYFDVMFITDYLYYYIIQRCRDDLGRSMLLQRHMRRKNRRIRFFDI